MSRAFVKESDDDTAVLPERVISAHPNFVTRTGLAQIDAQLQSLEAQRSAARAAQDRGTLARVERDLRYWTQRRSSARLIEAAPNPQVVRFGVQATVQFDDASTRSFRLVGEDEADPARGLISWVSPLGESLTGCELGDELQVTGRNAKIVGLES